MSDPIFVPTGKVWFDTPLIYVRDLFPQMDLDQCHEQMRQAARMMEVFLRNRNQKTLGIIWVCDLDRDTNPDGQMGRFRLYPKLP